MTAQNVFSQKKPLPLSTVKSVLDPSSSSYDKSLEAFARNWLRIAYEGHEDTGVKPWITPDHADYMVHLDKSSGAMRGRISLAGKQLYAYIENAYTTGLMPEYASLLDTSASTPAAVSTPTPAPAPAKVAAPAKPAPLPAATPVAQEPPQPAHEVMERAVEIRLSAGATSLDDLLSAIHTSMDTSQQILTQISAMNGRLDVLGEEVNSHHAELTSRIVVLERTVASLLDNVATIEHVKALQEGQRTLALLLTGGTEDFDEIMRDLDQKLEVEKQTQIMSAADVHASFMADPIYNIIATTIGSQNPTVLLNKIRHDSVLRGKVLEVLVPWLEESEQMNQAHRLRMSPLPTLMQYITHTVTTTQSP